MSQSTALTASLRVGLAAFLIGQAGVAMPMEAVNHDHGQHLRAMADRNDRYVSSQAKYGVPNVTLVDTSGASVPLRKLLDEDRPVMLNFIFTSCGAICPVMSATFAKVQAALGPEADRLRMVSISIDPEYDTPAVLKAYADKYGAGAQWRMLTGSLDSSIKVQRAFDVYRGNKMNHTPLTFLRAKPGQPWLRLEGFASASDLVAEYRRLTAM
ncbi:MAG: SCO family protein [Thiobacillus sp.]|nr:SCO family protein [Thiobacillus sp.]